MAIMHLSVKNGAKGKGAQHAKYIEREGKYATREDLVMSESGNMPIWAEKDANEFWKAADKYERENGRSYKELEISLPRELTREQQIELVRDFTKNVLGDGFAYTWAIHAPKANDGLDNAHVHLMFSERRMDGIERTAAQFFKRYNPANPQLGGAKKERAFNTKSFVTSIRNEWAATANQRLKELGIEARIDPRSYQDMGIDLESQNVKRDYGRDVSLTASIATKAFIEIQCRNGDKIIANPKIALDMLTANSSTFTKQELEKFIFTHTDGDEQYLKAYSAVLSSPEIRHLTDDTHRFTTGEMRHIEHKIIESVEKSNKKIFTSNGMSLKTSISNTAAKRTFNKEQNTAYELMTSSVSVAVVNGAAGTGKSYVLSGVNEAYTEAGYNVVGTAIQGITAKAMEEEAGIKSRTVASLLARLRYEQENPIPADKMVFKENTVLVVDEAGMIGSRDMNELLKYADEYNVKVRMVGDAYQLNAVSAGSAFSKIQQTLLDENQTSLVEIMRQKDERHREASILLSKHDIQGGLKIYQELGNIIEFAAQKNARDYVVDSWAKDPEKSIMLAYTNKDVQGLNNAARAIKRAQGNLGKDYQVQTDKGTIELAKGDDVIFKKTNKDMGILNGSRGRVDLVERNTKGQPTRLHVTLEEKQLQINLDEYKEIRHGYASTIHSSQGMTVKNAYLLASKNMNANLTYVAATRHKEDLKIVYSHEGFENSRGLVSELSKSEVKTYSTDFDLVRELDKVQKTMTERETLAEKLNAKAEYDKTGSYVVKPIDEPKVTPERQQVEEKELSPMEQQAKETLERMSASRKAEAEAAIIKYDAEIALLAREVERIERLNGAPAKNYANTDRVKEFRAVLKEQGRIKDVRVDVAAIEIGRGDSIVMRSDYEQKNGVFTKTKLPAGTEVKIESIEVNPKLGRTEVRGEISNGDRKGEKVALRERLDNVGYAKDYLNYLERHQDVDAQVIGRLNGRALRDAQNELKHRQELRAREASKLEPQKSMTKQRDLKTSRGRTL